MLVSTSTDRVGGRSLQLLFLLTCHLSHRTSIFTFRPASCFTKVPHRIGYFPASRCIVSFPNIHRPVPTNENRFQYPGKVGVVAWVLGERLGNSPEPVASAPAQTSLPPNRDDAHWKKKIRESRQHPASSVESVCGCLP